MGDACAIVNIEGAYVQENGIIRLSDGRYIGRLDGITFDEVKERVTINDKANHEMRDILLEQVLPEAIGTTESPSETAAE